MKKELEPTERREGIVLPEDKVGDPRSDESNVARDNLEVSSWIEKIEKRFAKTPTQPADITDDSQVVVQPSVQQPNVTLPVTSQQMKSGKKANVDMGIAWLITWAIRQMKLISRSGRKVVFKDDLENK